ncbi:hypothetical protein AGDE_16106 [Angomonas deanei]|uniref:Uncharacterized protein n=1 Tax=Angomonas deanei TaxID=59799 RepID=A0A7G2C1U9_9TRYP|nr:hypothetical protein AGDE_16106 [Angomonas deanei]CAD2213639.1 hypothetical protein, conserved [Angomonas deanei]|eukprot:EPY17696.1 hypothetical protein AGDE_16106 [Angomonas deanei]
MSAPSSGRRLVPILITALWLILSSSVSGCLNSGAYIVVDCASRLTCTDSSYTLTYHIDSDTACVCEKGGLTMTPVAREDRIPNCDVAATSLNFPDCDKTDYTIYIGLCVQCKAGYYMPKAAVVNGVHFGGACAACTDGICEADSSNPSSSTSSSTAPTHDAGGTQGEKQKGIPWWVWLIVGLGCAVIAGVVVFLAVYCTHCRRGDHRAVSPTSSTTDSEETPLRERGRKVASASTRTSEYPIVNPLYGGDTLPPREESTSTVPSATETASQASTAPSTTETASQASTNSGGTPGYKMSRRTSSVTWLLDH